MVRTKIVCTLGPSSSTSPVLKKMMLAGMDVARINSSHGNSLQHQQYINLVRKLNAGSGSRIALLQDLEGFRIRIGTFKTGSAIALKKGQLLRLTNRKVPGDIGLIPFDYEGALSDIKVGSLIFIDDGNLCLLVKSCSKEYLWTKVVTGGLLKEHKGVNIPELHLRFKGLKEKDRQDILFGIGNNVDYIAQSFVRDRQDMLEIRKIVDAGQAKCKLIAKIENRLGIKNIDRILEVCDGIMIARGDMGVSLPIYQVPVIQKQIIKKCNRKKKFVITATQMLESMTEHLRPTRAEVSDVANAVLDGTDYLMLSGETAVGDYPAECVRMMDQIVGYTEQAIKSRVLLK